MQPGRRVLRFLSRLRRVRFDHSSEALPVVLQFGRMVAAYIGGGFTPLECYLYHFLCRNVSRRGYVSTSWIERQFRPALNRPNQTILLKNKLQFYRFYKGHNLPVPEVLAVMEPDSPQFSSTTSQPPIIRTAEELRQLLAETGVATVVAKPLASLGGKGTMLLKRIGPDQLLDLGREEPITIEGFYRRMMADITTRQVREDSATGYLLQEQVVCHPSLNPLKGKALNTVRIATLRDPSGTVHFDFAMLRIAKPTSVTDNLHKGGVVAGIEPLEGKISNITYGYETDEGPYIERKSQDLSALFPEGKVPRWHDLLNLAITAHSFLPGVNSVGWDIALSTHGPVLIEGNDNWDMVIAQVIDGPYLTPERKEILAGYGLTAL
ncbi:MAG: sugar-transfer associated ATP-grasp domain-containing protein [candidate division WOR-3 bacterium]